MSETATPTASEQMVADPPPDPADMPGPLEGAAGMIPYLLIFAVLYFLVIRPNNQQRKQQQELLGSLQKGDEVVTSSGIFGRIVSLEEKSVILEIADKVRIRLQRDRVASRVTAPVTPAKT